MGLRQGERRRRGDCWNEWRGKTQTGGGAADPAAIGHHGHTPQFRDVLEAIEKGRQPLIDGPEGRRSVEIILAIYKAAETGKVIRLPLARRSGAEGSPEAPSRGSPS